MIKSFCARRFVLIYVAMFTGFVLVVLQTQIAYTLLKTGYQSTVIYHVGRIMLPAAAGNDVGSTVNVSQVSVEDFRRGAKTGNPLIDAYGDNDPRIAGEMGMGIMLTDEQNDEVTKVVERFKVNNLVSDVVPLNRIVPDSRLPGCSDITYNISALPSVSVIIPFYNEWPSLILRTVYSIINRTPRSLIQDIILVDDNSTLAEVKMPLDRYVVEHFPKGLVQVLRMPERRGLSAARMMGVDKAKGDVLVFFDSHMEVNIDWLPPLLTEITKDRHVVAMSMLDYIRWNTFEYHFDRSWMVKYGWDWNLRFFETYFRPDELGPKLTDVRPGTAMVGAAFAIDKDFFTKMGGYDTAMSIWGGENLEMTWRITMCGGRLVHLPCSKIGHVARAQPYDFPGGRGKQEFFNAKRAAAVWMGNYTRFVYKQHPSMKNIDVGDLSERHALRDRLGCKDFRWYMTNHWPELNIYDEDVVHWGQVSNEASEKCLDNNDYLFQATENLYLKPCQGGTLQHQGFSLTKKGQLRTTLQCVVTSGVLPDNKVVLEDCMIWRKESWLYDGFHLVHAKSRLCMEVSTESPILKVCKKNESAQKWTFLPISLP